MFLYKSKNLVNIIIAYFSFIFYKVHDTIENIFELLEWILFLFWFFRLLLGFLRDGGYWGGGLFDLGEFLG